MSVVGPRFVEIISAIDASGKAWQEHFATDSGLIAFEDENGRMFFYVVRTTVSANVTIVDATIIAAPSSTKNASNTRDPEMHQTKKGERLALWPQGPYWRGCPIGSRAHATRRASGRACSRRPSS